MFAFLCLWWLRVFSNPVLNNLLFSKSVTQSISNVCPLWWNTLSFNLCFPAVLPQRHERETSSQVWGVISAARCHDTEPHIHSRVTLMMTLWSWCTQRMKGFFYLQCADVFRLYFHTYLIKARWMHRQSHSCHKHITYVFHILSFCSLLLTARTDVPQLRKAVVKKVVANIIILCVFGLPLMKRSHFIITKKCLISAYQNY